MDIDLNILRDIAYQCACRHGFHNEEKSNEHFLVLTITEVAEAIEADRKNKRADISMFSRYSLNNIDLSVSRSNADFSNYFDKYIKDSVEDEMSDIVIRLLDLAGLRGIDVTLTDATLTIVRESFFSHYEFTTVAYHLIGLLHPNRYTEMENLHDFICSAISYVFLWSKHLKFDLYQHINWKMEYNELRPKYNVDILSHLKG